MPGIGIVTNPNSRRNRRDPEAMHRLGYVLGDDDEHEMTRTPDDIRGVAERFKDHGVDILALNGGDGTNHVTLTTFIDVYGDEPLPRIAFLRGGTMNTISNAVGVRGTPGTILLNLSERYHLGRPFQITEREILCIESEEHGRHYGFIFGNGFIHGFLSTYYEHPNPSPLVAARVLARASFSAAAGTALARKMFEPLRARVVADGEEWPEREFSAVVASTIEQIGLGFRPFTRCRARPGTFNALGIHCSPLHFTLQLPRIRLGKPVDPKHMRNEIVSELVFESNQSIGYTIDGDLHRTEGSLRVSAGPRLEIIVG